MQVDVTRTNIEDASVSSYSAPAPLQALASGNQSFLAKNLVIGELCLERHHEPFKSTAGTCVRTLEHEELTISIYKCLQSLRRIKMVGMQGLPARSACNVKHQYMP